MIKITVVNEYRRKNKLLSSIMKARIGQRPNHSRTQRHWSRTREGRRKGGGSAVGRSLAQSASTVRTGKKLVAVRSGHASCSTEPKSVGRSVGCLSRLSIRRCQRASCIRRREKSGCEKKEKDPTEGNWVNTSL